ncbi:MAG: MATE family efflux transporter [Lachnospiraceae bacterium]|nr:MATE family efflux transporter [Lachnospiraceae bacterium]
MRSKEIDMLHGPVAGKILVFALPLMLTSILQLLFNAADTIVVGRFVGPTSLAAVGATNSLVNLYVNFIIGVSVGANVLVAHELGAGNLKQVRLAVHTAVLSAVLAGILLCFLGLLGAVPMLGLMKTPSDVIDLSALYLRIYFLGVPFQSVYNVCAAILRANGDTKRPLVFLSISGALNVILNLFFVIYCGLNVAGVALATIISQCVSMVLILNCLAKERGALQLSLKELRIDSRSLARILRIGIPSGLQGCLFSIANVVIQSTVNSFGSIIVAGNSAAMSIEAFVYVSANSISQACQTFISQNYGAMEFARVKKIRNACLMWVFLIVLVLGNAVVFSGTFLCSIYTTDPQAIAAGALRLKYMETLYFIFGLMDVMVGALRGIGLSIVPMITSLVGVCAFRLVWIALAFPLNPVIENLYISYPISWALTFAAHFLYWQFVWKKMKNP